MNLIQSLTRTVNRIESLVNPSYYQRNYDDRLDFYGCRP